MMTRSLFALALCGALAGCVQSPPTVPVEERGAPGAPTTLPEPAEPAPPGAPAPGYPVDTAPLSTPETLPEAPPEPAPRAPLPEPVPGAEPSGALLALLEQAEARHSAGQTQQALSLLERAQRIAPREPLVYLQLARLRLDLDDRVRAEQLARKGLSLTSDARMRRAFEAILRELAR